MNSVDRNDCMKCGVSVLARTHEQNGGLCARCFNHALEQEVDEHSGQGVIWYTLGYWVANKNREWRDDVLTTARAVAEVLHEHSLITLTKFMSLARDPIRFCISEADLVSDNVAPVRRSIQELLAISDKWRSNRSLERYKKTFTEQLKRNGVQA